MNIRQLLNNTSTCSTSYLPLSRPSFSSSLEVLQPPLNLCCSSSLTLKRPPSVYSSSYRTLISPFFGLHSPLLQCTQLCYIQPTTVYIELFKLSYILNLLLYHHTSTIITDHSFRFSLGLIFPDFDLTPKRNEKPAWLLRT